MKITCTNLSHNFTIVYQKKDYWYIKNERVPTWDITKKSAKEIDFFENIARKRNISTLEKYVKVEVGIITSSNDFFTVPLTVEEYGLHDFRRHILLLWSQTFNSKAPRRRANIQLGYYLS